MEYKPSFFDSLRADIQPSYRDSLRHSGVKGQKWGVRRYQNPDGSLTPEGKIHYQKSKQLISDVKNNYKNAKEYNKQVLSQYENAQRMGYRLNRQDQARVDQMKRFIKSEKAFMQKLDDIDIAGRSYDDVESTVRQILSTM